MALVQNVWSDVQHFLQALEANCKDGSHLSEACCKEMWASHCMVLLHECKSTALSTEEHVQALYDASLAHLPYHTDDDSKLRDHDDNEDDEGRNESNWEDIIKTESCVFTLFAFYASQSGVADRQRDAIPVAICYRAVQKLAQLLPHCGAFAKQCVAYIRSRGDLVLCASDRVSRQRADAEAPKETRAMQRRQRAFSGQSEMHEGPLVQARSEVDMTHQEVLPAVKEAQELMREEEIACIRAFGKSEEITWQGPSDTSTLLENVVHQNIRRARSMTRADDQKQLKHGTREGPKQSISGSVRAPKRAKLRTQDQEAEHDHQLYEHMHRSGQSQAQQSNEALFSYDHHVDPQEAVPDESLAAARTGADSEDAMDEELQ